MGEGDEELEERDAQYGQRMLEVRVRFWTNDIADDEGKVVPKHAWTSGVVRLATNPTHGVKASEKVTFNSLMELPASIERLLVQEGVTLHIGSKMAKYMELD